MRERRETEEKFVEEGEKKRRRTGEKRYKEKVNKKVDGQRKRKPEKKHKGERLQMGRLRDKREKKKGRATGGILTEVKLAIKEKRQENGEEEGRMERKVHIGNK
jgi:hypothetical protein